MPLERVGVLGGTFNPVHRGHLHIARHAQRIFSLSKIYFVVAASPPHKDGNAIIPFLHRYAMVCLAVAGHPSFIPSMVELEPTASSFSIDTMRKLRRHLACRGSDLYFIAGGDSLAEISTWRESERLLTSYNFIFVERPGIGRFDYRDVLPKRLVSRVKDLRGARLTRPLRGSFGGRDGEKHIYIVDVNAPDISATRIRGMAGDSFIRRMVPASVCEYIQKQHLYGER